MRRDSKIVCEEYLDFIRSKPCIGCGMFPTEAHHLIARGQRESKRNDFTAVPVCRPCHDYFERHGIAGYPELQPSIRSIQGTRDAWREAFWLTLEFMLENREAKIERGKI